MLDLNYKAEDVQNLTEIVEKQKKKFEELRSQVRKLKFVPIEPTGFYSPIAFTSFDGGMFNVNFDPFELDIVEVADSYGNSKLRFAAPRGDKFSKEELKIMIEGINKNPIIKKFLSILKRESLYDVSEIIGSRGTLMELGEWACIFDKVLSSSTEEKTIILKDGLLRTKKIKSELIRPLRDELSKRKNHVKLIGVSKTSKIVSLLAAALLCEKIFPEGNIGYVEVPLELENMAYKWSGKGKLRPEDVKPLDYAFGTLYIAKLSKHRNLFVTIEIPRDLDGEKNIYSKEEILEAISYIAKDSMYSYPILGYPQTIMRAHEFAVRLGIPVSILRDEIMKDIMGGTDSVLGEYIRDGRMTREAVDKGVLGGGS